ncbi:MAG: transglutaminase-like domain-containing protein [Planctomycetota bacterium]
MKNTSSIHIVLGFTLIITVAPDSSAESGIIYSNPRVYNVDYSFEMFPEPNMIDRTKDLKVWLPVPREWDSQKAVKITSVQPEPHTRYVDPEYGNPIFFWDFGKMPQQPDYRVDIKFRLESYDVSAEVDSNRVGSYDKTSKDYVLYTRSTHTIHITPKIKELAQEAVGNETNPYLQAERIFKFVRKKMRFKRLSYERGRGIDCLLAYPTIDEETGQVYYEGSCNQYSAFMVTLCRAVGIPARCVSAYMGWAPWIERNEVKARYPFETKLSFNGLAATQLFGGLGSHMWCEFFIPNYGWIPADPQGGKWAQQSNRLWIKYKGRDVKLGPQAPSQDSEGYGAQWVALREGIADTLFFAVLNIAKIRTSKVTVVHHSDPFPADEIAGYPGMSSTPENLKHWRQRRLTVLSSLERSDDFNLSRLFSDKPNVMSIVQPFVCHMLRRQLGDEKYNKLVKAYISLRQKTGQPVSTKHFQKLAEDIYEKPLGWFFNQWASRTELPRLKLEGVTIEKVGDNWQVQGRLRQLGNTTFQLPIEIALYSRDGKQEHSIWMDRSTIEFDFRTPNEPQKLVVDPDFEVFKLQEMPPSLWWFWDDYPQFTIVYGTQEDLEANKKAADRFNNDYLGLDPEKIKADVDVNEIDLKNKCIFLIGRPETNRIAREFEDHFPIKFYGDKFTWQETTYKEPTQGVAQIIINPNKTEQLIVMYAGLSPEATLNFCDLYLYDADDSYIIFDGDEKKLTGNWEDVDSNLYWKFSSRSSAVTLPN